MYSILEIEALGIYLFALSISAVSQIVLKKAADREYPGMKSEYLNKPVISAYFLQAVSFILALWSFKFIRYSLIGVTEACSLILVTILGHCLLKERLSKRGYTGLAIIFLGVISFYLGG